MSGTIKDGPRTWGMEADEDGYREYKVAHFVRMSDTRDGPHLAFKTPGLPATGTFWSFGNDLDVWAWCTPKRSITIEQEKEGDPATYYRVENTFTTKPSSKCQDDEPEDPLLYPWKKSGTFLSKPKEATHDRFGNPLMYSSHEQITGPLVEFDNARATVNLEKSVAHLQLSLLASAMNHVNDSSLWGMDARKVKLSTIGWDEKFYGTCNAYYVWQLGFEVDPEGFDKDAGDQGTKVLCGYWNRDSTDTNPDTGFGRWKLRNIGGLPPDNTNPAHFIRYQDWNGNLTRVLLDGRGQPAISIRHLRSGTGTGTGSGSWDIEEPGEWAYRHIEKYDEFNFFLLGIPALLGV